MNLDLYQQWMDAKSEEKAAQERRREIEDQLTELFELNEQDEGIQTFKPSDFICKITQRMNRKVDSDALQEIAAEHGLEDHIDTLFRWKPEVNLKAWKAADESITRPLAAAVTTTPGRPSYNILKTK